MDATKAIVTAISVCIVGSLLVAGLGIAKAQERPEDWDIYNDFDSDADWQQYILSDSQLLVDVGSGYTTAFSTFSSAGPGNGDYTFETEIEIGGSSNTQSIVGIRSDGTKDTIELIFDLNNDEIRLVDKSDPSTFDDSDTNASDITVGDTYSVTLQYDSSEGSLTADVGEIDLAINSGGSWTGSVFLETTDTNEDNPSPALSYIAYRQNLDLPAQVTGTVKDTRGSGIKDAKITLTNRTNASESYNTTTATDGSYTIDVPEGNYTINATHPDYIKQSKTVNVTSGEEKQVNFILNGIDDALNFDAPSYMEHGSRDKYTASGKVDGDWRNITDDITVTSSNANVVLVDSANNELVATTDRSVSERVTLTVSWTTPDGETLNTKHNVTVANETVSNIGILPPTQKFTAVIGGGTDQNPGDRSYLAIFLATALASAVSLIATVTAGLAIMPVVLFAAMIVGLVEVHVVMAATLICIFLGLNIGQNIDYGVR